MRRVKGGGERNRKDAARKEIKVGGERRRQRTGLCGG